MLIDDEVEDCWLTAIYGLLDLYQGDGVHTIANMLPEHALSLGQIKLQLRLTNEQLVDALGVINQAFQQIRNDANATLFGFDRANHLYVHEATHRSIRGMWEQLIQLRSAGMVDSSRPAAELPFEFRPPQVGPSEDVAEHYQR